MPELTDAALKATALSNELMLNQLHLEDKNFEDREIFAVKIRLKEILDHLRQSNDKGALSLQHKIWLIRFQKQRQSILEKMQSHHEQPGFNLDPKESLWFQNPLNSKIAKFCEELDLGEIPPEFTDESAASFSSEPTSPGFHISALKIPDDDKDSYNASRTPVSHSSSISRSYSYDSEDEHEQPGTPRRSISFAAPSLKHDTSELEDPHQPGTPKFSTKAFGKPLQPQKNIAAAPDIKQQLAPDIKQQKAEINSIDEKKLSDIVGDYRNVFRGYFHRIFSSSESKRCRAAMQKDAIIAALMLQYGCEKKYITPDRIKEARYAIAQAYLAIPGNSRRALARALNAHGIVYDKDYKADFYLVRKAEIDAEKAQEAQQKAEESHKARAELDKALNLEDDNPQKAQAIAAAEKNLQQLDLKSKQDLYRQLNQIGAIRPSQHL